MSSLGVLKVLAKNGLIPPWLLSTILLLLGLCFAYAGYRGLKYGTIEGKHGSVHQGGTAKMVSVMYLLLGLYGVYNGARYLFFG